MTDFAFLHGGGQGGWVWEDVIANLQAVDGNRCLALDVPGCGAKTGRDTSQLSFDGIVDELIADLDAAGLKDIVLVGHSQAGCILPRIAERRPDLLQRLIYVTCSSPLAGSTVIEMIGSGVHGQSDSEVGWPVDPATHSLEERYQVMFCSDMTPTEAKSFLDRLGGDMWPFCSYTERDWRYDHLASISTSYVLCDGDMILPAAWQQRFAERFHADRIVRIDAGHQPMNTQPEQLARILLAESA